MADNTGGMLCELRPQCYRIENPVVVNAKDGSVMVQVPEGEFEMGSDEGSRDEKPRHRVKLGGYWIGVYAVTNGQYLKFVEATGHQASRDVWRGITFRSGEAERPVCVSWEAAQAYAQWAGCEMASEAQWERACRGPRGLAYPWGDEWDQSKCRNDKNENERETACEVHRYPRGVSGWGTYNQSGNLREWCADWYDSKYYGESPKDDPRGPAEGSNRVIRGGGWKSVDPAIFRTAKRGCYSPDGRWGDLGFRLVRTAS